MTGRRSRSRLYPVGTEPPASPAPTCQGGETPKGNRLDHRTPVLATNILPLPDFKARASELLNAQKEHKQPLVITRNGKAAAVLIPPEEYDMLVRRASFIGAIERGLADADSGRMVNQAELAAELAARYGRC